MESLQPGAVEPRHEVSRRGILGLLGASGAATIGAGAAPASAVQKGIGGGAAQSAESLHQVVTKAEHDTSLAALLSSRGSAASTAAQTLAHETFSEQLGWSMTAEPFGSISHTSVQAAATKATKEGVRLVASGSYETDQTLVIGSDCDLSGLTVIYTGAGTAVQLGSVEVPCFRLHAVLPRVVYGRKPRLGWARGTVGVLAVNLNSCASVIVPHVQDFETGLSVYGHERGNAYNTFLIGHLANNKTNLQLDASTNGWTNQNTFVGGRYGHNSEEGANVPGARHVRLGRPPHPINNNAWVNPSLEGNTPEFHADIAGTANIFVNGRWEARGGHRVRVRWQAGASRNQIMYGYGAHLIQETFVPGVGTGNDRHTGSGIRHAQSSTGAVHLLENSHSSAAPADMVMAAGSTNSGKDPLKEYCVSRSATATRMKRPTDQFDRLRLDHPNGRVFLGNGTEESRCFIGAAGTGSASTFSLSGARTRTTSPPTSGQGGPVPTRPSGYLGLVLNGTLRYIPYY